MSPEEARAKSEFTEKISINGTKLLCIAPHGGDIDLKTDLQTIRLVEKLPEMSFWMCQGYRKGGGAFTAWHTTSNDISPNSFPCLQEISKQKFDICISFHGMQNGGILIGGGASNDLKLKLKCHLEKLVYDENVEIRISTWQDNCNGLSKRNVCNWLTKGGMGGIQLEQDRYVRNVYWKEVTDAVYAFLMDVA